MRLGRSDENLILPAASTLLDTVMIAARAEALAAGDRRVAIQRADLVDDRDILEVLAGETGAEHEFRGACPVAEILRQRRRAGDIELARRFVDGAVGPHQGCEKLLGFAGAGVSA